MGGAGAQEARGRRRHGAQKARSAGAKKARGEEGGEGLEPSKAKRTNATALLAKPAAGDQARDADPNLGEDVSG